MTPEVVVAGHLCLDVIPRFHHGGVSLQPGRLVEVGAASLATGGAVANVGLALHRLGVAVGLMGKTGDDPFGGLLRGLLSREVAAAAETLRTAPGESTSYTLVISPPGTDRLFLHHPGCNDSFGTDDIDLAVVERARAFYFGYPPLMHRLYADGGASLAALLERIRGRGILTVLDMAMPDPGSAAGRVDWRGWLGRVLPHVDLFLPSLDETLAMLGPDRSVADDEPQDLSADLLSAVAGDLLGMGAGVVGLKLGALGLYLRTAAGARLAGLGAGRAVRHWWGRELYTPVFRVEPVGTTGSGDATVAGLLAGLLRFGEPERALMVAAAVGACSVEAMDAVGGVRGWDETLERIGRGWQRSDTTIPADGWCENAATGVWRGPADAAS